MTAGTCSKPGRRTYRSAPARAGLAALLLSMIAACGGSPEDGSTLRPGETGGAGEYYCVPLGGRKLCFERDDIYWPVHDGDDRRGLVALMPAYKFDDPECSQPASTVEDVKQFLIAELAKGEDLRRWFEADYEHYEPHLTTSLSNADAGSLDCRTIREKSPVPYRGFLCKGRSAPASFTLVTCSGDDVPVPDCDHKTYADGLRVHLNYPRQCFPHWKKLESIPLAIIRDARIRARSAEHGPTPPARPAIPGARGVAE